MQLTTEPTIGLSLHRQPKRNDKVQYVRAAEMQMVVMAHDYRHN